MSESIRVAIVGGGYWGRNLIRNFSQLGALHAVCDRDEHALERVREAYPGVKTFFALSDVLADNAVDAVVVSTPAETHHAIARECLLAGKHAFVEKPLTLDEGEAADLIDLARDQERVLMVGHLLQYHAAFIRLKEMVHAGELGRINYVYSNRLNLGKIRREENIFWSFAPHDISMLLSLTGEQPESVSTMGGNYLHERIADVTMTHLDFPSGLKAHIFVSWLHPFKEQKFVVVGERKMAVFDDTLPWDEKLTLYPHQIRWEGSMPVPDKALAESVAIEESEPLKAECCHFLECVQTGAAPRTDGEEGLRVLRVLKLGQRSLDKGGKVLSMQDASVEYQAHETAVIDDDVSIGRKTRIWHFTHVMPGSVIGENCSIGQNVTVGPKAVIGDNCKIQNNVSVYPGVTLEDGVFCGPSMVFTNVFNPRATIPRMKEARSTLVKKGATLGANCTIVCGYTVGEYSFVGAGAVITRDVPSHALMAGNPARRMGWVCECGVRLSDDLTCPECGLVYGADGDGLKRIEF